MIRVNVEIMKKLHERELTVGKPTVFIPSPNVAEDHQTKNAKAIADKNGAVLLRESELDEQFENTFSKLLTDENWQKELSQNIKKLAKPNATEDIVEEIWEGDITIDEAKEILTRIKDYRAIEEILSEDEEEQKITHKIIQIKRIKRLIKEGNIEDMKIIFGSQLNA